MEEAPPSRVLHIRKLPNEASETEVIALGLPFGKVTNILTLKGKNQVSVRVPAEPAPGPAEARGHSKFFWHWHQMLSPLLCGPPAGLPGDVDGGGGHDHGQLLRHRHAARAQRSRLHPVLQSQRAQNRCWESGRRRRPQSPDGAHALTDRAPPSSPQRTQAVLQAVSAVQSGGSPSSDVQEALAAASSPVLRIIIDNMFYPVTLDVLQQVGGVAACCHMTHPTAA